jgi:hypothetical protein
MIKAALPAAVLTTLLGLQMPAVAQAQQANGGAAAAASNPSSERFEVSAVEAVRPFLVETLTALQEGNIDRAKAAFEAYDSGWNGIEVYINTRSRALYQVLELDLQARIAKALIAPRPDMAAIVSDVGTILAKYDEAIDTVS